MPPSEGGQSEIVQSSTAQAQTHSLNDRGLTSTSIREAVSHQLRADQLPEGETTIPTESRDVTASPTVAVSAPLSSDVSQYQNIFGG